jgi:glycosyltransferase involved in cell wall biosynthesis
MAEIHIVALDATRQGGAGVYTLQVIEALVERGHTVTLICHEASDTTKAIAVVLEIPRFNAAQPFGLWRFSALLQLWHYKHEIQKLKLSVPEGVIISAQPMGWGYLKVFPHRPFVYLPHSLIAPMELKSYPYANRIQKQVAVSVYFFLEKTLLEKANATIRFTNGAIHAFKQYYGQKIGERLVMLPMPISIKTDTTPKMQEVVRLLSVGRLVPTKNLAFLIGALSTIRTENWYLDIVGDGPELNALQIAVKDLGLQEKVEFHGHSEKVEKFYQSADLFVFPSLLENSPVVVLEAMSHALPALAFLPDGKRYRSANDELIIHKQTGLLANGDEEFTSMLAASIRNKDGLHSLGAAARKSVEKRNSWSRHVEALALHLSN